MSAIFFDKIKRHHKNGEAVFSDSWRIFGHAITMSAVLTERVAPDELLVLDQ
jgi:hypothetical protein